jgi:hypothetical protein
VALFRKWVNDMSIMPILYGCALMHILARCGAVGVIDGIVQQLNAE